MLDFQRGSLIFTALAQKNKSNCCDEVHGESDLILSINMS